MTTQPDNLPFIPDPNYDHILTDDDRNNFAPLQVTDEYWLDYESRWRKTDNTPKAGFSTAYIYRRRKPSGWVSVKERLPEANTPFMAACGKIVDAYQKGWADPSNLLHTDFTHWQPWTLPALPQPPKPTAEVACEKWMKALTEPMSIERAFLAGSEWAKENRGAL